MRKILDIAEMEEVAGRIRLRLEGAGEAAPVALINVIAALFFQHLRHDPARPAWPQRDRLILSRGHGWPVLVCALAEAGHVSTEQAGSLLKPGSSLPPALLPLLEASSGAKGCGLSIGLGHALMGKMAGAEYRVYVLLADSELHEDVTWDAATWSSYHKAQNLCAIVDGTEDSHTKWRSLNWNTIRADGRDMASILGALSEATRTSGKPTCVLVAGSS